MRVCSCWPSVISAHWTWTSNINFTVTSPNTNISCIGLWAIYNCITFQYPSGKYYIYLLEFCPCIIVVELPFKFNAEVPVVPRWTHSKHKHLIRILSFRRQIKAKMNSANNKVPAMIHDGSNTVKLNGREPFESELRDEFIFVFNLFLIIFCVSWFTIFIITYRFLFSPKTLRISLTFCFSFLLSTFNPLGLFCSFRLLSFNLP